MPLPAGLALNASTGALVGQPTAAAAVDGAATDYTFTVQGVDSLGQVARKQFTITVNPAVSLTLSYPATGTVGVAYSGTVTDSVGNSDDVTDTVDVVGDPYWANVVSLLHFDGTDGSTTFTDVAGGYAWTGTGNAQIDTADSKFGGASLLLDGTGDFAESPNTADHSADADYTIECFIKSNSPSSTKLIATKRGASIAAEFQFLTLGNKVYLDVFCSGGTLSIQGTTTVGSGWRHVAATRSGATWRIFLDGNLEASGTQSGSYLTNSEGMVIGRSSFGSWDWDGWIDEFRITKGVARYTANFTPPSAPFPDS